MEITAQNAIYLGEETGGKGRQFRARFLVPGLVKYDYGVCLLTKENADKFMQGFIGCPVVINHQDVTDDNVKDVAVGDIFSVWFDEKDGYYWCNGIIRDKEAIKLINEGYSVSCQYLITEYSENTTGALHNGNPYDKVIENGKPEHLAIVNNPRYEGAIIAVNAILAENEDKWITIKPNGEDAKGKHLLVKEGETPSDAVRRVYGDKNQKTLFDTKEYKKTKEDFKKEAEDKQKEYDKIEERHKDSVKQEQEASEKKKNKAIQDYINGEITQEELEKIVPDMPFNEWLNLADKRRDKNKKQTDKEEKEDKVEKEKSILDIISERDRQAKDLKEKGTLKDIKMPKSFAEKQQEDIDKGELVELGKFPTKFTDKYQEGFSSDTDRKGKKVENKTASNSFIDQFKDTLYTVLAEEIFDRLGE